MSRHGGRPLYQPAKPIVGPGRSALRPKVCLLAIDQKLRTIVASKLILDWSPEQISAWLKIRYPKNESMRVSHETIYRSLFIQARGVLKKELIQHLRSKRLIRRSRHARAVGRMSAGRSSMPSLLGKDLRRLKTALFPAIGRATCLAAAGTVTSQPWWNDISRSSCSSKCPAKTQTTVVAALSKHVRQTAHDSAALVDLGRGHEMAKHKSFTVDTKVKVYFCDPQSPWQRGTNENTNGLLKTILP